MRTYTHGVIGYLLYARRPRTERRLAVVGALMPDAIVGLGFVFHVAEPWTSLAIVADLHALLHLSWLHTVTVALHSFVIIGPLLLLSWLFRRGATPLFVGMMSHAVVDLLTHRTWAYNHVWPIPLTPVRSLVSYTDIWFTILEHALLLLVVLWWYVARRGARPRSMIEPAEGSALDESPRRRGTV
jgi:membrane-bound metal-dependent hydrolase YbcI (DUF457 family)